jgi:hypothetical protein
MPDSNVFYYAYLITREQLDVVAYTEWLENDDKDAADNIGERFL